MTVTQLNLASRATPSDAFEFATQRIQRLQQECRGLAREQVEALCRDMDDLAARAAAIGERGEIYPAGVREMASRITSDLPMRAKGMRAIADRMSWS